LLTIVQKILNRLRRTPQLRWLRIVVKDLTKPVPFYESRLPITVVSLPDDVAKISAELSNIPPEHWNDIQDRLRAGHRCNIAKHQGQTVYSSWVGLNVAYSYLLDRTFELSSDQVYLYGSYTIPEYRNLGIQAAAMKDCLTELKRLGYKQAIAFIEPGNKAAQRMPQKLGFDLVGITGLVELFGIRFYFHRDKPTLLVPTKRNYWRKV
jgi:GNAT superfamily N-acetyltransferase